MTETRPFIEHLEELRSRLLISLALIVVVSFVSFFFRDILLKIVVSPINTNLVFISPHEAFYSVFKLSFLSGFLISSPFTLYQLWKFIGVACNKNEKKKILLYVPISLLLFLSGSIFAFKIVLPIGLDFLISFGSENIRPMISLEKYISFASLIVFVFSLSFQLPLVMRFLSVVGIADIEQMRRSRRYSIVVIFIVSAVLTPPDVFTQFALALPILCLYEIGLLISVKKKKILPVG